MLFPSPDGAFLGAHRAPAWAPGVVLSLGQATDPVGRSAAVTLLLSAAHKPRARLDHLPLQSQPMVGLLGVCGASHPRHYPHFHGPADNGCHP